MYANLAISVREVDLCILAIAILNSLCNINLILVLKRLKDTNIKRLKEVYTIRRKLKRYNLMLPIGIRESRPKHDFHSYQRSIYATGYYTSSRYYYESKSGIYSQPFI